MNNSDNLAQACHKEILGTPKKCISKAIVVHKLCPQAETLVKESQDDIGWDVTLVNRTDNRAEDTLCDINEFGTGLSLQPPTGYYLEITATNSLHRHGYMLPGPILVDNNSEGELIIPLYKFRDTDDITLPFRAVRIITKPTVYIHISQQKRGQGKSSKKSSMYNSYSSNQQGYSGDMQAYQAYNPGVPRPHAPPRGSNHMF